jgi:predicted transport protein
MQQEGVPVVILNDEVYNLYSYKLEEELEKLAIEHTAELFGKNTHFFNVKRKIVSKSGIGSTPDGYLVDLTNDKFFIIEVELSSHDIVRHVMNQLSRFKMAMDNSEARYELAKFLASTTDTVKNRNKVSDMDYLARIIGKGVGIFIIIDSISEQLNEVVEYLAKDGTDVRAIPFETYTNSRNQSLHKFTTFTRETLQKEAKKWTFKWTTIPVDEHLDKINSDMKNVFSTLSKQICSLPNVKEKSRKNWITFQTSPLKNFCTVKFLPDCLEVHIKCDDSFMDQKGITKKIERTPAWTFDRVFTVSSQQNIEDAMHLISQAYQCTCVK